MFGMHIFKLQRFLYHHEYRPHEDGSHTIVNCTLLQSFFVIIIIIISLLAGDYE